MSDPEKINPTLEDIYLALVRHVDREAHLAAMMDELYKEVKVGNGVPSLVDTVRTHGNWIASVNRLVWLFVAAIVGQIVVGGCSLFMALFIVLQAYSQTP